MAWILGGSPVPTIWQVWFLRQTRSCGLNLETVRNSVCRRKELVPFLFGMKVQSGSCGKPQFGKKFLAVRHSQEQKLDLPAVPFRLRTVTRLSVRTRVVPTPCWLVFERFATLDWSPVLTNRACVEPQSLC